MRLSIVAAVVLLTGCTSADMLQRPGDKVSSAYGPVNQEDTADFGVVRYLNEGVSAVIESRRNDAYKQMYNQCGGKYELLDEASTARGSGTYTPSPLSGAGGAFVDGMASARAFGSSYTYIKYRCVK